MPTPYESAKLILELYELRREETMRAARDWYIGQFNPTSIEDISATFMSDKSAYLRMVTSYWDMAASLVNHGAIDEQMFNDANAEHIGVFAKLEPFVADIRETSGMPQYLQHLEQLVMRLPDARERLEKVRESIRSWAAARAEATNTSPGGAGAL